MAAEIKTFEYTPQELISKNHFFAIPIYQRLYAWEESQIVKLLEDLYSNFLSKPDRDYFIGNWVIYQKQENERYDIIDGQQRMTTLWLMGFVLQQYCAEWKDFIAAKDGKLRLDFIARESDGEFLKSLLAENKNDINSLIDKVKAQGKNTEEINPVMINALKFINEFMLNVEKKEDFSKFIFEHTKFVGILLPNGTDLNKYFEVMNNRGVQLEKHEILKALLLAKLSDDKRKIYANIWNACANMNVYIESFTSDRNKSKIADFSKDTVIDENFLKLFDRENADDTIKLSELLERLDTDGAKSISESPKPTDLKLDNKERCGSILNFPSFLLHILRFFKNDCNIKIEDKDLIDIFQKQFFDELQDAEQEQKVIEFLNELLRDRILFDKFVIKSIAKDNDFLWQVRKLEQETNGSYIRNSTSDNKALEMVEAFLQVSTQQDIWLSLLQKKIGLKSSSNEELISYLETVDDFLANARLSDNKQQQVFEKLFKSEQLDKKSIRDDWDKLLNNGTSTPRYWFFKLDYLLWKDDTDLTKNLKKATFQFRQNRSVEHIHAQSQNNEINNEWTKEQIDAFGNLALISVSSNSQNNDNNFEVKKAYFKQRTEKYGYESLKLALVFENENWTATECKTHQDRMTEIIQHYNEIVELKNKRSEILEQFEN